MAGRKVFTAGEVLAAADVNNFLMDQTVMVFADSTARSSAIGTATEGMITYLESDNKLYKWTGAGWENVAPAPDLSALIPKSTVTTGGDLIIANGASSVTRLGIGTNGQVLRSNGTTATWTTPAAGKLAWTLLSTTTPSGAGHTVSSLGGYDNYLVVGTFTVTGEVYFSPNSSDTGNLRGMEIRNATATQDIGKSFSYAPIGNNSGTSDSVFGSILVLGASSTNLCFVSVQGGGVRATGLGYSIQGTMTKNNSALTSMTFKSGSGSFDGGTVLIYGA